MRLDIIGASVVWWIFFSAHSRTVFGFDPFRGSVADWNAGLRFPEKDEGDRLEWENLLSMIAFPSICYMDFDCIALIRAVEGSNLRFCELCCPARCSFRALSSA